MSTTAEDNSASNNLVSPPLGDEIEQLFQRNQHLFYFDLVHDELSTEDEISPEEYLENDNQEVAENMTLSDQEMLTAVEEDLGELMALEQTASDDELVNAMEELEKNDLLTLSDEELLNFGEFDNSECFPEPPQHTRIVK